MKLKKLLSEIVVAWLASDNAHESQLIKETDIGADVVISGFSK